MIRLRPRPPRFPPPSPNVRSSSPTPTAGCATRPSACSSNPPTWPPPPRFVRCSPTPKPLPRPDYTLFGPWTASPPPALKTSVSPLRIPTPKSARPRSASPPPRCSPSFARSRTRKRSSYSRTWRFVFPARTYQIPTRPSPNSSPPTETTHSCAKVLSPVPAGVKSPWPRPSPRWAQSPISSRPVRSSMASPPSSPKPAKLDHSKACSRLPPASATAPISAPPSSADSTNPSATRRRKRRCHSRRSGSTLNQLRSLNLKRPSPMPTPSRTW